MEEASYIRFHYCKRECSMIDRLKKICYLTLLLAAAAQAFTVSGTVTDYLTKGPIGSCLVILDGYSPGAGIDTATTGDDGRYSFNSVMPGVYTMLVTHDQYAPDTSMRTINSDLAIPIILFNKTYLLDSIPDTLYKERSPYVVRKGVGVDSPVTIRPGVVINFIEKGSITFYGGLSAIGTKVDSIIFKAALADTDTLYHPDAWISFSRSSNYSDTINFTFCRFENLSTINGYRFGNLNFENCLFTGMRKALTLSISMGYGRTVIFSHNRIINCIDGIADHTSYIESTDYYDIQAVYLTVTANLIQCANIAFRGAAIGSTHIEHNTILGFTALNLQELSRSDTVANNIFSTIRFDHPTDSLFYFAYNTVDSCVGWKPLGIDTPAITNANGDSCDFFYNIFTDPRIVDSTTGQLRNTSPCIGAASDGTNMGVYQGEGAEVKHSALSGNHGPRRLLHLAIWTRNLLLHRDAPVSFENGDYALSLYTVSGRQIGKTGMVNLEQDRITVLADGVAFPLPSPGTYIVRLFRIGTSASFPVIIR